MHISKQGKPSNKQVGMSNGATARTKTTILLPNHNLNQKARKLHNLYKLKETSLLFVCKLSGADYATFFAQKTTGSASIGTVIFT